MKKNAVNYRTLIVTFAEPIRILNNYFNDAEAWVVASLKKWIDGYESTHFTQTDGTAVITSEKFLQILVIRIIVPRQVVLLFPRIGIGNVTATMGGNQVHTTVDFYRIGIIENRHTSSYIFL